MENEIRNKTGRRDFLMKTFSTCAFCCFAAPGLFGFNKKLNSLAFDQKHKFQMDSGMTIQQVYNFAFKQWYIPVMKNLMKQVGKEKFLEMLKKSSEMLYESPKETAIDYNDRTLTSWSDGFKKAGKTQNDRLTFEILTDNDKVFEARFTECLWAKTFREKDAADIGYAGVCYQDYPMIKSYNPNLKLIRERTLMQGHDCCQFKLIMET